MADNLTKILTSVALVVLVGIVCYNTIKGIPMSSTLNNLVTIVALYSKSPTLAAFAQSIGKTDASKK